MPIDTTPPATRSSHSSRRPDLDSLFTVNADGSHNVIHTADVHGRFQLRKRVIWSLLVLVYLAFPWIEINGHPAVLIDIAQRHFYLFGKTFNAQDFPLAFFYLSGIGFTLIVLSALFGRVWCGYACPQTVFLDGLFRRIERLVEGTATQRKRLQELPWSLNKVTRRGTKLLLFALSSLLISHTFLSYFIPVAELRSAMLHSPAAHPIAFTFVLVFSIVVFVNFTWFREQLCLIICPYGRLQGVLADKDTINVGYDKARGEPRGKPTPGVAPEAAKARGDCVDCMRCVSVCPTGIDIRNGSQFECIGCANCIDACDEVMVKVGRPTGLVRYDSLRGFETGKRRFVRPRLWLYAGFMLIGLGVFLAAAGRRISFEANLIRASTPYTIENGTITNQVTLHLFNKQAEQKTFHIEPKSPKGAEFVIPIREVILGSMGDQRIPIFVRLPERLYQPGTAIHLAIRGETEERDAEIHFVGPR